MPFTPSHPPDPDQIHAAYEKVCRVLLNQRTPEGHWIGRLSDSALSTATAISAFSVFCNTLRRADAPKHGLTADEFQQLETLIPQSVAWLIAHQNPDGGWGDTDKSLSNISTTLLVKSALCLATSPLLVERARVRGGVGEESRSPHPNPLPAGEGTLEKADEYIHQTGGIEAIKKRYGKDQTFSVPILTNAALAGLVEWKEIPQLPFELAALPMAWFRFVKLNVVSYAIPALVAIGQVRFHFLPNKGNPFAYLFRRLAKKRTLRLIQEMQPESGGYLEAAPLTVFVVMSLSAMGLTDHPIVTKGIRFLLESAREGGSLPIDTNLTTWLTSLSLNALQGTEHAQNTQTIDWLLSCQHKQRHPFTGAAPGGWGWTDLSGAVPDADDTAAALLALAENDGVEPAAIAGIKWLLGLQNRDGGIPTFCQGWGALPFDKSSTDLTAHAIRAFQVWRKSRRLTFLDLVQKMERAEKKMFAFLERSQQKDGSWLPLWFGNQFMPDDVNPYYGTAKVLLAFAETKQHNAMTLNALRHLIDCQNADGGWGQKSSSVEETAVVVEALSAFADQAEVTATYHHGLSWLLDTVESNRFQQTSPIGLYFAKLWYYEDLYPAIFTASALRRALRIVKEQP